MMKLLAYVAMIIVPSAVSVVIALWKYDIFGSKAAILIPKREEPFYLRGIHVLFDGYNKALPIVIRNKNNTKNIIVEKFSIYIHGKKTLAFSFPDITPIKPMTIRAGDTRSVDVTKCLSTIRKEILAEAQGKDIIIPQSAGKYAIPGKLFQIWIKIEFDSKEENSEKIPLLLAEGIYTGKKGKQKEIKSNQDITEFIVWYEKKEKKNSISQENY